MSVSSKHRSPSYGEMPGFVVCCSSAQADGNAPLIHSQGSHRPGRCLPFRLQSSVPPRPLQASIFKSEFLGMLVLGDAQGSIILKKEKKVWEAAFLIPLPEGGGALAAPRRGEIPQEEAPWASLRAAFSRLSVDRRSSCPRAGPGT